MLRIEQFNELKSMEQVVAKEALIDFLHTHLDRFRDEKSAIDKCLDYAFSSESGKGGFVLLAFQDSELVGALVMNNTGMAEFIAALRDSLSGTERRYLTPDEAGAIGTLRDTKYATWEWNWGESPEYTERKVRRFPWGKVEALLNVKNGILADARFFGDFFGVESRDELEGLLAGSPFRKEDLRDRLSTVQLDRFFRGTDLGEFLAFLIG